MDGFWYRGSRAAGGWLAALLLRAMARTWRTRVEGPDPFGGGPVVVALWHRGLFVALGGVRRRGLCAPVSRSRDGDWICAVLRHLGFAESPRGSTSRGGSALLRALVRAVRAGFSVVMLPDGPRGPAGEAQAGAVALAQLTGARLVPVGLAARPAWRFGSWDGTLLPLPFARVRVCFGAPVELGAASSGAGASLGARDAALESGRLALQEALHAADAAALCGLRGGN